MTAIGWLIVLFLIGFFVLVVLRLAPPFMEYYKVVTALSSLENEPGLASKSRPDIRKLLQRRLDVNDVKIVKAKDVKFESGSQGLMATYKYEQRVPFIANIDLVVKFDKSVPVGKR
jgi:hypothetical protein